MTATTTTPVDTKELKERIKSAQCHRTASFAALAYDNLVEDMARALDELERLRALLPKV